MPIPDFQNLPVLVTGGAGFIGSHLVDALRARRARVRVLDNFSAGRRESLAHHGTEVEIVEADLRDPDACHRACAGRAYVFHQAALGSVPRSLADPATTIDVNVTGTANLLAAAERAGVRRVVFASSSSVYGDSDRLPKREGEEGEALSPYAASKQMGERLAAVFGRCLGLETIGLRYFNVYGPRQDPAGPYAAVIPRFFHAGLLHEAPVIYGDGEQSRDFTFVGDAVTANLLAAGAGPAANGRAFNIAAGERTTINRLAALVREALGDDPPAPHYAPPRQGDVLHSAADLSAAARGLGYAPTVGLAEGLRRCLDHYRQRLPTGAG